MKNTKKRGFTIVELVIVIAVIAILASVLIPTFTKVVEAAKKSKALQQARNMWYDYIATLSTEDIQKLDTINGTIKYDVDGDAATTDDVYYFTITKGSFMGATTTAGDDYSIAKDANGNLKLTKK